MQSMVIRDPVDQKLYMFSKGADETIFELLKQGTVKDDNKIKMQEHVDEFAKNGLRTLVYAMRILDDPEMTESKVKSMPEIELERDLTLIGVSGMADQLQEEVHKCISDFIEADIKVWIVTGDKDSTA